MAQKTVTDLKAVRAELQRDLLTTAYNLTAGSNQRVLERFVLLDQAICALDTLIEEGLSEPAS